MRNGYFSKIDISDPVVVNGSSLLSSGAMFSDAAYNNGVLTIVFADMSPAEIMAGTLATFTFRLNSAVPENYMPVLTDSSVAFDTFNSSADVDIIPISPAD